MNDWRTYDDVAETYERVHASRFAESAGDLVEIVGFADGADVLDVGTGTRVAAQVAADAGRAVGSTSRSACSASPAANGQVPVAAAQVIDLPFGPGRFDAAIGSFVLAHFSKVETALFDIARVLRVEGQVRFTSWTDGVDAYQQTLARDGRVGRAEEMLAPAYAGPLHGASASARTNVEETLIDAGFRSVRTEVVKYHWTYALDDYLDGLQVWATGRFVRNMLGESGWASLRDRTRAMFAERSPIVERRRGHHRDGDSQLDGSAEVRPHERRVGEPSGIGASS